MEKGIVWLIIFVLASSFINAASLDIQHIFIQPPGQIPGTSEFDLLLNQLSAAFEAKGIFYIYANGQRIAKIENDGIFYFHNDHLGSVTIITNSTGDIVEEKKYDPFGIELAGESKIGYNSKELDKDTDLNYYGSRYYTSEFGRFVTPDTVKGKLENPQSLNLYAYTLNNPMRYIDPSGNQAKAALSKQEDMVAVTVPGNLEWVPLKHASKGETFLSQVQFEQGKADLEYIKKENTYYMIPLNNKGGRERAATIPIILNVKGKQTTVDGKELKFSAEQLPEPERKPGIPAQKTMQEQERGNDKFAYNGGGALTRETLEKFNRKVEDPDFTKLWNYIQGMFEGDRAAPTATKQIAQLSACKKAGTC